MKKAIGWILTILGGFLCLDSVLCIPVVFIAEGMTLVQRIFVMIFFIAMAVCNGIIFWVGLRLKKNSFAPQKKSAQLTVKPTVEQQRLHEIEQEIDSLTSAVQETPVSPETEANNERIAQLEQEKQARLKRIAKYQSKITVQDARNTFLPEQQKRFEAQLYQYSQDVERGGLTHEVAAANRGLVFVDNIPVPTEVAKRLEEMRRVAADEESEKIRIQQEIKSCSDFMSHAKIMIVLEPEWEGNRHWICVDKTSGYPYEVWTKVIGHSGVSFASTTVEVFEKPIRKISYDEMISLAEAKYPGLGEKYAGINENNWQEYSDTWLAFAESQQILLNILNIKQKIIREAHRLVETYNIDTKYYRDLDSFGRYVNKLEMKAFGEGECLTCEKKDTYSWEYSFQAWERGCCNFAFDGDTEDDFVEKFLIYCFFENCLRCYHGHYLSFKIDKTAVREKSDKCCFVTDILTGYSCYGKTYGEAEAALKNYIDQLLGDKTMTGETKHCEM